MEMAAASCAAKAVSLPVATGFFIEIKFNPVCLFQMRELAEDLEAGVDLFAGEQLQALGAEALYGEGSHDAAVEKRALDDLAIDFSLGGDVSHEPAGKGIAGAGGVLDLLKRQGGGAERMSADAECTFAEKDGRAVLAVLDDQSVRPEGED